MKGILEALHDGVTAAYRLRNLSRIDAHLLHSREQRSPVKPQARCGAVRAADAPLGLF
jgi:hypothetical protein